MLHFLSEILLGTMQLQPKTWRKTTTQHLNSPSVEIDAHKVKQGKVTVKTDLGKIFKCVISSRLGNSCAIVDIHITVKRI